MPLASLIWIVGPVVLLSLLMMSALRRAARRQAVLESARVRSRSSEAGLASAMTDRDVHVDIATDVGSADAVVAAVRRLLGR